MSADLTAVELRCPVGPKKLLAKVLREGEAPHITDGNLMELSCRDCTHRLRAEARSGGHEAPLRVVHRFNVLGDLIESAAEYAPA